MSRQWEWLFAKVGEVGLSITAMADSLTDAVYEANAGLRQFFTELEQFQAENRVQIQIDPFCHGHLASVTCPDCGADVTRLASQTPAAIEAAMVVTCECSPEDGQVDDDEVRALYARDGHQRQRALR